MGSIPPTVLRQVLGQRRQQLAVPGLRVAVVGDGDAQRTDLPFLQVRAAHCDHRLECLLLPCQLHLHGYLEQAAAAKHLNRRLWTCHEGAQAPFNVPMEPNHRCNVLNDVSYV